MDPSTRQQIDNLLANPDTLILKRPFTRGLRDLNSSSAASPSTVANLDPVPAHIPNLRRTIVSQGQFLQELDPECHKVLHDQNIPSITMKVDNGGYVTIEYRRMAVPFQRNILDKQVLHLCNNPMSFLLMNPDPSPRQAADFINIKQQWNDRNMEGHKTQMVRDQKSSGDAALLFYYDRHGRVNARNLSYADGYSICTHRDKNGEHLLECLYYASDTTQYIDCYDDQYLTRFTLSLDPDSTSTGWLRQPPVPHGFPECPLITKRGDVAWNAVQSLIEVYEVIYNIFLVIQKRHGWGVLYVKGDLSQSGKKVAGAVILNDKSMADNADAKFLAPPSPQNMIETLELLEQTIQKGAGTTFILPKDVKTTGDISGVALQLTQELDIETANRGVGQWQNVANKMMRLFKAGLAVELVSTGENPSAITDYSLLNINTHFQVWRPQSNEAYNAMLGQLYGQKAISRQTLVEKNTESAPDELARIAKETPSPDQTIPSENSPLIQIAETNAKTIVED